MNRKEIKKQIEFKALNEFKDINLDISNIEIDEPISENKIQFSFKRGIGITFASLFILLTSFFIYNATMGNGYTDVTPLNSETEILGFQTVSSAALLSSFEVEDLSSTETFLIPEQLSQNTFDITDELNVIAEYMNLAETMFGSSNNYAYNDIDSDKSEYEYAFEYKGMDFGGNLIEYIGYYNEIEAINDTVVVEGILISNHRTFNFSSETISDDNGLQYKYNIMLNSKFYVEVTNYSTENTQEFSYDVYKAGEKFNSSTIRLYENKNDIEAEIIITDKFNKELKLELSNLNDNNGFNVKYNYNNSNSGNFTVELVYDEETQTNKFQFSFQNGTVVANRIIKGNKKAKDSDFLNNPGNDQTTDVFNSNNPGNRRTNKNENSEDLLNI